ncbi:MAG: c-type cytochrome [Planctomycetota bacterium]|nr:c-type cytochrome [Planctomycetota bacterium]
MCEDTDGDGRADRFTVFAEKLSIPTSLMFSHGGVIVFNGTQTIYLKDDDGDDVADTREVLFERWSQGDTHGGPSNMQYGLDNWIWAMQGYNFSRLTVGGETHSFRQGFLRFRPDASRLEFIRSTDNNTWGFGMSEEGIVFGSTANRNPSVYMPIPNRYYESVRGWAPSLRLRTIADTHRFRPVTEKVRQVDHHDGYTAGAGHALYTARRYPQEYWNRTAFVCGPTGHLVGTFVLRREASDFSSSNPFNLLASHDEWTAPIMAEVGPDGNVWVIDWYNYIVQHNPTPAGFRTGKGAAYESDLRDKKHGRIYRIVYGKEDEPRRFSLGGAGPEKLVAALAHDNMFWRQHAQRLLVERGKRDVLPALYALASRETVDAIGLNVGAIHALWTIHGLGALDGSDPRATAVAYAALKHRSAGVRRNAVQVLPPTLESVEALLAAGSSRDRDAQVRLMALLALADLPPTEEAGRAIVAALSDPTNADDRWITDAATCAAAKNNQYYLQAVATSRRPAEKLVTVSSIVAEHYGRGAPVESVGAVIASLADADTRVAGAVVEGLAKGWPADRRPRVDERLEERLGRVIERLPAEARAPLIKLASTWGSTKFEKYAAEVVRSLTERIEDESLDGEVRLAAARELVAYRSGDDDVVQTLLELVTPRVSPDFAGGVLRALEKSTAPKAAELIADRLPAFTPAVRTAGVSVLLSRAPWTRTLLAHAVQGKIRLTELALDQRQTLTNHGDPGIRRQARDLLREGGALPNPDRQKVLDKLLPLAKEEGNAAAGKLVFKKVCASCHVHGEEGQRIGPDLTGMAVHSREELLTEIIDPNRSVEGNFRVYAVVTSDGLVLNGLLASESRTSIELFDSEGKKRTILRQDIIQLDASSMSLMPEGFEKQLTRQEIRDLLAFLTERGKYVPLTLDKVATAVSTVGMFASPDSRVERLVFDDWGPKTVEGVPFQLVDPQGDRVPNVVLLHGPQGRLPPRMPRSVSLKCNSPLKAIHLLGGVSGWGHPYGEEGSVSMIVRLHYEDGQIEDHELKNGEHFADYIRRVDVPGSRFAFNLRGRQLRYLAVSPRRTASIELIEFVKGNDDTAPILMAVTAEILE